MNVIRGWHFKTPKKKFERKSVAPSGYRIIEYVPEKTYVEKREIIKKRRAEISEELLRLENARADAIAYHETARVNLDEALLNLEEARNELDQATLKHRVAKIEVTLKRATVITSRELLRRNTTEAEILLKLGTASAAKLQRATERLEKIRIKKGVGRIAKPRVYNAISKNTYGNVYMSMITRPNICRYRDYKRKWLQIRKLVELKIEKPLFERIVCEVADSIGASLEKS